MIQYKVGNMKLIDWHLRSVAVIIKVWYYGSLYGMISWLLAETWLSFKDQKTLLMGSKKWFRWWRGAARQQAIASANVNSDLCCHIASPGHNEFITLPLVFSLRNLGAYVTYMINTKLVIMIHFRILRICLVWYPVVPFMSMKTKFRSQQLFYHWTSPRNTLDESQRLLVISAFIRIA